MTAAMPPAARIDAVPRAGLPEFCDAFLGAGDFFASRAWYDTLIAHAIGPDAAPCVLVASDALLPMLRQGGRLTALTTPYTLVWRPLFARGADAAAQHVAGREIGRLLRRRPPVRFDAVAAEAPGLEPFLDGMRRAGIAIRRYRHFGNWHDTVPAGLSWTDYLAARPPELRTTVGRKLARCAREMRFTPANQPGEALDAAIRAYEDTRARSWKPHEPFPDFDAALMRAAAAQGVLRSGALLDKSDGRPAAAQYWIVTEGRAVLVKLAHAEDRRAASPGTALTAMMIRRLLEEDGVRELDFGRGDDPYKRLWVGQRRERIGLVLADPRHPLGLLELARQAAGDARRRLRGWLGRGEQAGTAL